MLKHLKTNQGVLLANASRLLLLSLLFFGHGCARLKFETTDSIPLSLGPKAGNFVDLEYIGRRDFYLWGLLPTEHEVDVARDLEEIGAQKGSKISVQTLSTWSDYLFTWLTLGMYRPLHYKITAFGPKDKAND